MLQQNLCGTMPENPILAYSYVPIQAFGETYSLHEALSRGTLFPALDKPLGVYGRDLCKTCNHDDEEAVCCDLFK